MNNKLKTAFFSYLEAGVASAIVLAYNGGSNQPIDFLWAFVAGFAGPLIKYINPLDAAFGFKPVVLRNTPKGTKQQIEVANAVAKAVVDTVAEAVTLEK